MVVAPRQSVRYAITDLGAASPGAVPFADRLARFTADLRRWSAEGVDIVQLREPALDAGEIYALACAGMAALRETAAPLRPRLLVNGRADIAIAAAADGVHLTSRPGELFPAQVRRLYAQAGLAPPLVSVSCHGKPDILTARENGADLLLFGPVFGKTVRGQVVVPGVGLDQLSAASRMASPVPVLALGGVTWAEEEACLERGAMGVAGIRLFAG